MTWVKLDDGFYDHPKVEDLTLAAVGLWTLCASYCGKHLSNGYVSYARVGRLGGTDALIDELVESGMWDRTDRGVQFHDWDEYQPTRQSVEDKRAQDRERQRKHRRDKESGQYTSQRESRMVSRRDTTRDTMRDSQRDSRMESRGESRMESRVESQVESHMESQRESRMVSHHPVPARPDPTQQNQNTRSPAPPSSERVTRFDEFWDAYPRKVGKQKAKAKYAAAVKRAQSEDAVIEGARRLAADPNLPEQKFIPHPTTWLERDGWEDEPLPARFGGSKSDQKLMRAAGIARGYASAQEGMFQDPYAVEAGPAGEVER